MRRRTIVALSAAGLFAAVAFGWRPAVVYQYERAREWIHDHVLLMSNGEYLIYAFRHGFNDGTIDHLFLAHGSDGKWYYSTYHFCSHMAMIRSNNTPASIADFASRYSLRVFDGKSDECLTRTWVHPPDPFYQASADNVPK